MTWLFYCSLVLLSWGLWAFLPKLATRTLDAPTALVFQQAGAFVAALYVLVATRFKLTMEPRGIAWSFLAGVLGVAGLLCYLQAVSRYRLSVVVMVTALYPIITIALSVLLLRERITAVQCLGVLFALVAIALMAYTPAR